MNERLDIVLSVLADFGVDSAEREPGVFALWQHGDQAAFRLLSVSSADPDAVLDELVIEGLLASFRIPWQMFEHAISRRRTRRSGRHLPGGRKA